METPNCYQCAHRRSLPGDAHSKCVAEGATVTGNMHGRLNVWFCHPYNYDPIWLESCDSFQDKPV